MLRTTLQLLQTNLICFKLLCKHITIIKQFLNLLVALRMKELDTLQQHQTPFWSLQTDVRLLKSTLRSIQSNLTRLVLHCYRFKPLGLSSN